MAGLTPEQKLEGVRALLNPRNVAIVGASDRPGNWSLRVFQMLRRFGFPGAIYAINPRNKTVWNGETCYPSLAGLPEKPDHVVVIVPGAAAIDTIVAAGKAGARSATVFTGGFGEGGDPKGIELGSQLKRVIDESGLAVSGPNCLGNLAAPNKFITIPDDRIPDLEPGPVAVLGQSGGIVMAIQRALGARGMRTSYALTTGNEVGLYTSDYIRYLADDANVKAIACFIESIRNAANSVVPALTRATTASRLLRSRSAAPRRAARPRWRIPGRSRARSIASTRSPRPSVWCESTRSTSWWSSSSISPMRRLRRGRGSPA